MYNMADFAMALTARELGIVSRGVANAAEGHQRVRKLRADLKKQWALFVITMTNKTRTKSIAAPRRCRDWHCACSS